MAAKAGRGVVFLYDEAHTLYDQPRQHQYPLGALLGAFVQTQDQEEPPLPVMLAVSGLPPLVQNLQAARSHAERLFRVEELGNLALEPASQDEPSSAALALIRPAADTGIPFEPDVAQQVAADVDGYPYFIQKYGEALWDAADAADLGGERFEIARLAAQFQGRNANATQQSVNRLLKSNHAYRVSQGSYAYTAPLFGAFVQRAYPRRATDR